METALRLLMRDGALHITFKPKLTPDQYTQLFEAAKLSETKEELRIATAILAKRWHCEVDYDVA